MSRPQNSCLTLLGPSNQHIRAPKLSQNQRSELKETQKMKVVQVHEQTTKQLSNLTPTRKIAHQGPKKSKLIQKLSQNQMSEFKETQKMKVVQVHEQTSKQLLNPMPTTKIARQGPKKVKNYPKIMSKSNVRIERNKEDESCSNI